MELEFDKKRKWTIMASFPDNDKKEVFVKNWGVNETELKQQFNISKSNGFEKDISENELKRLLNYVVTNCIIEGVYDLANHFNTDQKTLNEIKKNIETRWEGKGYTIVEHCDCKPSVSDQSDEVYGTRAYLKQLVDLVKHYNEESDRLNIETHNLGKELESMRMDKEVLSMEIDKLRDTWKRGQNAIKEQDANFKKRLIEEEEALSKLPNVVKQVNECNEELKSKEKQLEDINKEIEKQNKENERLTKTITEKYRTISDKEAIIRDKELKESILESKVNELENKLINIINTAKGIR